MKTRIICLFIFIHLGSYTYSQNKESYSIQIGTAYLHYHQNSSTYYFNYGFSSMFGLNINRLRIRSGLLYTTETFSIDYEITPINPYHNNNKYSIRYINVPITVGYEIYSKEHHSFSIHGGVVISNVNHYTITETYQYTDYTDAITENIPRKMFRHGFSYHAEFQYGRILNRNLAVLVAPYFEIKTRLDHDYTPYFDFPAHGICLGLKLALEHSFK